MKLRKNAGVGIAIGGLCSLEIHGRSARTSSERPAMTDPAAEALAKEQLFTVLARLIAKINLLDRELRNFDRLRHPQDRLRSLTPFS
jgi:hypothetical protein